MMGIFDRVPSVPADTILGLLGAFKVDSRPHKINLIVGYYQTDQGKTLLMPSVREAEERVVKRRKNHEYLLIQGDEEFLRKIEILSFGKTDPSRSVAVQTVGGTGALRLFADFFSHQLSKKICVSNPTWLNHRMILMRVGCLAEAYPYYNAEKNEIDFEAMVRMVEQLPEKTAVLLQASCHNPTGMDLSMEQWELLSDLFKKRHLFPFFDMAYQGFGEGLEKDAQAVRLFHERGHEMAVAYSCSKNFSLYGERVGALFVISDSAVENIRGQLSALVRTNYSTSPSHGAAIVKEVLSNAELEKAWKEELTEVRARLKKMRVQFSEALANKIPDRDWSFMRRTQGLFCYTGLKQREVERLIAEFGIYMPIDGRLNIAALNDSNLDRLVDAISKL